MKNIITMAREGKLTEAKAAIKEALTQRRVQFEAAAKQAMFASIGTKK